MLVYGRHVDLLERLHVPSLLLPGNIDPLLSFGPVAWVVFAPRSDVARVSQILEPLRRHCYVTVEPFSDALIGGGSGHDLMCKFQREALSKALALPAGLMWLYPDTFFPEDSFATLGDIAAERRNGMGAFAGQGMSLVGGNTLYMDGALPRLTPASADLLSMTALEHQMHSVTTRRVVKGFGVERGPMTRAPWLMWWQSQVGYVGHVFCGQPVIVWPRRPLRRWVAALDGDFFDAWEMDGTIDPTTTMVWFEARENVDDEPSRDAPMEKEEIAQWAARECTPSNIRFLRHQLRPWNSDPVPEAQLDCNWIMERALDIHASLPRRADGAAYASRAG